MVVHITDGPKDQIDIMAGEIDALRRELNVILDAIYAAPWREIEGERLKRICFMPSAIERIRCALGRGVEYET